MNRYLNLLFHEVTDDPNSSGLVRKSALPYKHSIQQFDGYIDQLVSHKERFSIQSGKNWHTEKNVISVSFDDGGISNLKSVEMLEKVGMKSSIFVITDKISKAGFLSESDIRDLKLRGHIIGSHSHTHPNVFRSLSKEEMLSEWKKSKSILEEIIGEQVNDCSIPGGDASPLVYKTAAIAGYKRLFDSEPITEPRMIEGMEVYGRICLKTSHSEETLRNWLNGKGIVQYQRTWALKKAIKKIASPLYIIKRNLDKHEG